MEYTGPPQIFFTVLYTLIALALVAIPIRRGELARAQQNQKLARARTRRAYQCFPVGLLTAIVSVGLLAIAGRPFDEQQGYGMMMGMLGGVPAAIALVIGLFHALMVWRVALIRVLLVSTAVVLGLFFANEIFSTNFPPDPWGDVIAVSYALLVIVVSARGLLDLRRTANA